MENLKRIFETILNDDIAFVFCGVIVVWLVVATLCTFIRPLARHNRAVKFVVITPNSLATLGVLGTFYGIVLGLLDFDVNRINDSVPTLLAGLKIAFTTSIVGIFSAIFFRFLRVFVPATTTAGADVTPENIHAVLVDIRSASKQSTNQLDTLRDSIQSSLGPLVEIRDDSRSASEQSAKQLKKLRDSIQSSLGLLVEIRDDSRSTSKQSTKQHKELLHEFSNFAKHMTENNQKAVIEALEQVIRDFNQKLSEQFGENFKQLNEAVHELVAWQDNYREHVEALEARLDTAVNAVEASQKALESVQHHSERIPEAIKVLEPVLSGINTQTKALEAYLEAIAMLRDKAVEAFPIVEDNLKKITTQLTTSVGNVVEKSQQALENGEKTYASLTQSYDSLTQGYAALTKDADKARKDFAAELANTLEQMSDQSKQELKHRSKLLEVATNESQELKQSYDSLTQGYAALTKDADKARKDFAAELANTLQQMSDQSKQELKHRSKLLEVATNESQELKQSYDSLTQGYAALTKDADKARKDFAAELANTLEQMSDQSKQELKHRSKLLEVATNESQELKQSYDSLTQGYAALTKDADKARKDFAAELANTLQQMSDQSKQEFKHRQDLLEVATNESQKLKTGYEAILQGMDEARKELANKQEKMFENFDQQMQQELTRSLNLLGKNMASISEKLAKDYTPLLERLHELLRVSEGDRGPQRWR